MHSLTTDTTGSTTTMRANRFRTSALAATALLAALSLTACSDTEGDNGKSGAAAPASSTASPETGKDAGGADTAEDPNHDASSASKDKGSADSTGSSGSNDGKKSNTGNTGGNSSNSSTPVTCTGDNTKVTISKVSRPINHLLLTATNTGSRPCYAYNAPALRFDDAQSVFPVLQSSTPQAVVALEPGQSAYAGIGLFGESDGKDLYEGTDLTVYFTPRSNSGSTGSPTGLKLPAGTHWGDNGFVTYWQSDMAVALTY
ncbi:DUF4232 domain-containing protein [Streptomyces sp. NPDC001732]